MFSHTGIRSYAVITGVPAKKFRSGGISNPSMQKCPFEAQNGRGNVPLLGLGPPGLTKIHLYLLKN